MKIKISQFSATRSGITGSQEVAGGVSGHFCLVKTPSIAIWGKICFLGGGGVKWGGVGVPFEGRVRQRSEVGCECPPEVRSVICPGPHGAQKEGAIFIDGIHQ